MKKKFLLALPILLLIIQNCGNKKEESPLPLSPAVSSIKLEFNGFGAHGIFDPSVAYDSSANRIWMSYSAVENSLLWPTQNRHSVTSRLAFSEDGGLTWTDSGSIVNNFSDVILSAGAPNNAGTWHNEVSDLIYDPGAVAGERWKLFWHHYLLIDGSRKFEHGWIGYKTASSPSGLAAAPEAKLFTGMGYDTTNDVLNNVTTRSPLGGSPLSIQGLHSDLNTCLAFSEPGIYANSSAIYASLLCPTLGGDNQIVLLKCSSPCNVSNIGSWQYISTPLDNSIASNLGYSKFSAAEIFESAGNVYLMVSPESNTPVTNSYNGCIIFQFADIDTGGLVGGASPTIVKTISGSANSFNGACGYHASAVSGGFLYSEAIIGGSVEFQIFISQESL